MHNYSRLSSVPRLRAWPFHIIVYIVPSLLFQFALNTTQTDGSVVSLWLSLWPSLFTFTHAMIL
jgi:hypothetical protein